MTSDHEYMFKLYLQAWRFCHSRLGWASLSLALGNWLIDPGKGHDKSLAVSE